MRRLLAAAALLGAVGVIAPMLAPHDPDEIIDVMVARYLPPGSAIDVIIRRDGTRLGATALRREEGALVFERGGATGSIPLAELAPEGTARRRFLLGADAFGRDLLSRVLHGARLSIGVTLMAVGLGLILGVGAGALAGLAGGLVDAGLMRLVDVMHAVPRLFLFLLCAAVFRPSEILVGIVLGLTGWIGIARIVRGQVLVLRETTFVLAARALGLGQASLLWRHVLPHCSAPIGVAAVLLAADTVIAEGALSFLGVGVQPPAASWGSLIAAGRQSPPEAWWITLFPGVAILAMVLALHMLVGHSTRADRVTFHS